MVQEKSVDIELDKEVEQYDLLKDIEEVLGGIEENDRTTFDAFAQAFEQTGGMPQLAHVTGEEKKGGALANHAIIAYKIEDNALYVSDPNYPSGPGTGERKIVFNPDNESFSAYSSGRNATEAEKGDILFDSILYAGGVHTFDLAPIDTLSYIEYSIEDVRYREWGGETCECLAKLKFTYVGLEDEGVVLMVYRERDGASDDASWAAHNMGGDGPHGPAEESYTMTNQVSCCAEEPSFDKCAIVDMVKIGVYRYSYECYSVLRNTDFDSSGITIVDIDNPCRDWLPDSLQ